MKYNTAIIPEVVHGFNVYDGSGGRQIGITDEMSLAEISSRVASVTGPGIMGTYEVPVIGYFDSITQEIPFRTMYINLSELINPMKVQTLNIRGAIQVTDTGTGVSDFVSFRYMIKGRSKTLSPGSLKPGDVMGTKVSIEATYILIEIAGNKVIEIDKLNSVFRIDGVDLMEKVRKMC